MFDAKAHLIQLPRRVKDPITGQFTTCWDEYLEVKWRLVWFREKYPHGRILTEEMCVDLDRGYARYRATVEDGEGGTATGTGTETRKSFEDFVEKAETRAIGRALAALGIGTQFVGEELSEGEHVADSPMVSSNGHHSMPDPLLAGESPLQGPPERHPTADEITTLVECARAANVDLEAFGHDMRRLMQLPERQKITKKFLRESMTMAQYNTARAHYGEPLCQILEEDVLDYGTPATAASVSPTAPVTAATATTEGTASPFGSSSAPDPDIDAGAAREQLRQEAIGWGIAETEIDHIVTHHSLDKARTLLWKARRPQAHAPLAVAG